MYKLCGLPLGLKFWTYTAFTVLLYGQMWRYYICFIHIRGLKGLTSVVHQRPAAPLSDLHFQWKHSDGTSNYFYDNILKKKIPKPSLNSDLTINYLLKKHIWVNFPRTGKMVKLWHFSFFLELCCDQTVWFFQLFSAVLKRFCPLDSKNVFVLVLAHSEPELERFEADDIGNDGDDDLSQHYLPNFKPTDKISSVQLRKLKKE